MFSIFRNYNKKQGSLIAKLPIASHRNLSPVHKMKGHLPIHAYNHLLNDSVPPLRRKRDLHLFQFPVKSFQRFPLFSPRAFLLLNRFSLPLERLVLPRQLVVTLAVLFLV